MFKENSEYLIERYDNVYEVVIGLEVHAQVTSNSKLFSSSSTKFGAEPNTQVSLVDAAFPGMLPVINEFCVKQAIKTGIGLRALKPIPVFIACFTQNSLITGSIPGKAASTKLTCVFGSAPNLVEEDENNFELDVT